MRPSHKTRILEAAVAVIQRDGVTSVTYESVAEEVGMTKGGLLYHFPTREALILGVHEYMAGKWESALLATAGKPIEETTAQERLAAYATVATSRTSRAELLLALESVHNPEMSAPFAGVTERWTPPIPIGTLDDRDLQQLVARLAADGLWLSEALTDIPLSEAVKQQIAAYLAAMIRRGS